MDDEVIPCGGALLLLADSGAEVHVVFASDSSAGLKEPALAAKLQSVRRAEAARVREYMKFSSSTELGFPDSDLARHETALATALKREIERVKPEIIFCPFPADAHSDHMSCAWATGSAVRQANWQGSIYSYELWTPLWPNSVVDISRFAERKAEAIRIYASQLADRDYTAAALGLNRYRGLVVAVDYAEAFYVAGPEAFAELTAMLDEI